MNFETYRSGIASLGFGKRLPGAVYVIRPQRGDVPAEFLETIRRAEVAAQPDGSWNLLKLHTDQFALTFLSYPDFDADPHPALAEAAKINLNSGSVVRTDYRTRANPPILHRKETFLPPGDSRIAAFAALTKEEEAAGLYRDPSRIGLRIQWQTLLKRLGLSYGGHSLKKLEQRSVEEPLPEEDAPEVVRHRTAIKRYDLSKPVKQLLERGLLRKKGFFTDFRGIFLKAETDRFDGGSAPPSPAPLAAAGVRGELSERFRPWSSNLALALW